MTDIPIQLLNAFVIFNESANITEAAKNLGITQPALSKQLKSLEEKMKDPLFTFSGRKKVLTPFGRDLHKRLKDRLGGLQDLIRQCSLMHADPRQAQIQIAARRGIIDRCCGKIKFPGTLNIIEASNDQSLQNLLNQVTDIGIIHSLPETSELIAKPLFKEQFKIVIPKTLMKVKRNYGKHLFEDLTKIPCIAYKMNDEILQRLWTLNSMNPKSLRVTRATSNYISIAEMVSSKLGWATLPAYLEIDGDKNWIVPIPDGVLELREFFIAYRTELKDIDWFKDLIKEITASFR